MASASATRRAKASRGAEVVVHLPALHTAQRRVLAEAAGSRYRVLACGRRWGKSYLARVLAALEVVEGRDVGYFAPSYKLLIEFWEAAKTLLAPIVRPGPGGVSEQLHRLQAITGGSLECWSLVDEDAGRSRSYARAIIDEAGMVPDLQARWRRAIRPTLADRRGDAWFLGTPKGMTFFHDCYTRGADPQQPDWRAWQMPTGANPYIHPEEVEAMRAELTEQEYAQEVLAEFLADGSGVFRGVQEACVGEPGEPVAGHEYSIGVDWGQMDDYSVFSVLDMTDCRQVAVDRCNQLAWRVQRGRLAALVERYRPTVVLAETNSIGSPNLEELQAEPWGHVVRGFATTSASKDTLIRALGLALERRAVVLLADEVQRAELLAYTQRRLPSGAWRYSAPEGMHDDTVIACALSWLPVHEQVDWDAWLAAMRMLEEEGAEERAAGRMAGGPDVQARLRRLGVGRDDDRDTMAARVKTARRREMARRGSGWDEDDDEMAEMRSALGEGW